MTDHQFRADRDEFFGTSHHSPIQAAGRVEWDGPSYFGPSLEIEIEIEIEPGDATIAYEFNDAYNPCCAYIDACSCPLPPHENWFSVPDPGRERPSA